MREVGSVPESGAALGIGHDDPWTEEPGSLLSHKELDMTKHTHSTNLA